MKPIEVTRIAPRYSIEIGRDELRKVVYRYLSEHDTRLKGKIVNSYCTTGGGFYILLEEETH